MEKPKVSVIIPVYNAEKHLRKCLDSVCRQTLDNIEIICVDDGSTDNSLNILQEYAQNDIRVHIYSQKILLLEWHETAACQMQQGNFMLF